MSVPSDAEIITDGIVLSKTIKKTYDYTGREISSELISFVVYPSFGKEKVMATSVKYFKKAK